MLPLLDTEMPKALTLSCDSKMLSFYCFSDNKAFDYCSQIGFNQ